MHPFRLVLLAVFTLPACLTEATECPPEHKRMRGLCLPVDNLNNDDGQSDANDASDDASGATACYLDFDHDGVGSGDEVDCDDPFADLPEDIAIDEDTAIATDAGADTDAAMDSSDDASTDGGSQKQAPGLPAISARNDDCDDQDPQRAPTLTELCDGVDNDCNEEIDDNARNVCGGTCTRVLEHAPGDACDNGQQGACARTGQYVCQGDDAVVCNAPTITASAELCGDDIDNDCDGVTDEPDAVDAMTWYQDCDGDGYAASTAGAIESCSKPADTDACTWTQIIPQPDTKTNWDCNDANADYTPDADWGFPQPGETSWDLNCDGVASPKTPIHKEEIFICINGLVSRLNSTDSTTRSHCDLSGDGIWDGCILWKDSTGKYTNTPSTKCPDNEAYKVLVNFPPFDDGGGDRTCRVTRTTAPIWPCR